MLRIQGVDPAVEKHQFRGRLGAWGSGSSKTHHQERCARDERTDMGDVAQHEQIMAQSAPGLSMLCFRISEAAHNKSLVYEKPGVSNHGCGAASSGEPVMIRTGEQYLDSIR